MPCCCQRLEKPFVLNAIQNERFLETSVAVLGAIRDFQISILAISGTILGRLGCHFGCHVVDRGLEKPFILNAVQNERFSEGSVGVLGASWELQGSILMISGTFLDRLGCHSGCHVVGRGLEKPFHFKHHPKPKVFGRHRGRLGEFQGTSSPW